VAVEILPLLEEEAKERQRQAGREYGRGQEKVCPKVDTPIKQPQRATEIVGKIVGVGKSYVSDAKKIKESAPELLEKVKQGDMTIKQAVKQVKKEEQRARTADVERVSVIKEQRTIEVNPGQFWRLGGHTLYCGDTSKEEFISNVPQGVFAFADPPYNAGVAEWDNNFVWQHDWLIDKADIVAVTPGIVSIFEFARKTEMSYLWSVACWINNGRARGAMGFGNWVYTAIFSNGSIFRNSQDFLTVTLNNVENNETDHRGRKPAGLLVWLIDKFSKPGDTIIDPFLGSGTTLLAAESTGRFCFGGEINPQYCAEIIARWEKQTDKKAVLIDGENSLSA
jgi:ParB family chromosome partitioning protein